ncbi:class I SAM-dependent DNA methyltransferase, partial [Moraxella caviae]
LEVDIFKELAQSQSMFSGISLDQFYGIEIDDFAIETARLSMYLAEHKMNQHLEKELGIHQPTLPLVHNSSLVAGNSLRLNWHEICPNNGTDEIYIIGNPPFGGSGNRSDEQTKDMEIVFQGFRKFKFLDYVACWFWKGTQYIKGTQAKLALVSTNSLCQGEQVAMLWKYVFEEQVFIHFAYQSFPWANNARDKAAVHVVIVGLSAQEEKHKTIYKLTDKQWFSQTVGNISPYLMEGSNIVIESRENPVGNILEMVYGNKPADGGFLLLSTEEKDTLLYSEPKAEKWIRKLLGADEFLNGGERYCLWLVNITEDELSQMPLVQKRIEGVRQMRLASRKAATVRLASTPHLFAEIRQPNEGNYILVPRVSSAERRYIPMNIISSDVISSDANTLLPNATMYEFGVLNSLIHNDWMRTVAGRLGMGYRYSNTIVYNTFPFPNASESQKAHIAELAEEVLLVRSDFPEMTLAQMYNPETMPAELKAAHETLDRAVEKLYREKPFADAAERVEFLFGLYEKLIRAEKQAGR